MTDRAQAARRFAERWKGRGDEKSDTQTFWLELLHDVCGVERPGEAIEFEKRVELDHVSFIDAYLPGTRVIIEQKSLDVPLDRAASQSDGAAKTPFEQAKRYRDWLPASQQGRWIVVCNFREFRVHDMERPKAAPEVIWLEDLPQEWRKLQFLADPRGATPQEVRELDVSVQAGALVGKLYNALLGRYVNPKDERSLRSLNILCVRLVFLLYAEDDGLNGQFVRGAFHDYLASHRDSARHALTDLFTALAQRPEERDPYGDAGLGAFPYVNGGLFEERGIEIPNLDGEPLNILLDEMSAGFDWSGISPTIFGAVFESTLNPQTRRGGGMHYTSVENIHRVIDPLFLDRLNAELDEILSAPAGNARTLKLQNFQKRLAGLTFLDPACGSGNFLTETYLSLRRLENRIISELARGQISFAFSREESPIQVSIGQFYGIEVNDFAVSVARTALWIAEAQMMKETRAIVQLYEDVLPLKSYNHIVEGNALRLDWGGVVPKERLNYVMGNPPFVGYSFQERAQKEDILSVYVDEAGKPYRAAGKIDYVAGWYFKAAGMMRGTNIRAAFVSTNSITQGEQVAAVWRPLYERFGTRIDFAWRTFVWDSEASDKAHVHVVIVGFYTCNTDVSTSVNGVIYDAKKDGTTTATNAANINPYLVDGPVVFIESRQKSLCDVPEMVTGNRPTDGGHLLLGPDERQELLRQEPQAEKYIKRFMGSMEFLNGQERYCLWLVGASPTELKNMPAVRDRIEACRQARLRSPDAGRRKLADTPWLFRETLNPESYLIVPKVSSERRQYVPIGFQDRSVISSDLLFIVPDATLYHLGVLESSIHMAWMRAVCGRLEMRYRYSKDIVYNNFPWPSPTEAQRAKIEETAQGILDARLAYPDSSLADLYDETLMPAELRKAHRANDAAVCAAYGFPKDIGEGEIVARVMGLYEGMEKDNI